jgi:NAD(P) transhydrogenase subunit alpha
MGHVARGSAVLTRKTLDDPISRTSVGVPAESHVDERRVALVPKVVSTLVDRGIDVIVEPGAGRRALLPDDLYIAAGAAVGDAWSADTVVKVAPPSTDEVARMRRGQNLIAFLAPRNIDNAIDALRRAGVRGRGDPAHLTRTSNGRSVVSG